MSIAHHKHTALSEAHLPPAAHRQPSHRCRTHSPPHQHTTIALQCPSRITNTPHAAKPTHRLPSTVTASPHTVRHTNTQSLHYNVHHASRTHCTKRSPLTACRQSPTITPLPHTQSTTSTHKTIALLRPSRITNTPHPANATHHLPPIAKSHIVVTHIPPHQHTIIAAQRPSRITNTLHSAKPTHRLPSTVTASPHTVRHTNTQPSHSRVHHTSQAHSTQRSPLTNCPQSATVPSSSHSPPHQHTTIALLRPTRITNTPHSAKPTHRLPSTVTASPHTVRHTNTQSLHSNVHWGITNTPHSAKPTHRLPPITNRHSVATKVHHTNTQPSHSDVHCASQTHCAQRSPLTACRP
jgi:hypothetical protein